MTKKLLVTGSSGLIGSEVCVHFARELGCAVHGSWDITQSLDDTIRQIVEAWQRRGAA